MKSVTSHFEMNSDSKRPNDKSHRKKKKSQPSDEERLIKAQKAYEKIMKSLEESRIPNGKTIEEQYNESPSKPTVEKKKKEKPVLPDLDMEHIQRSSRIQQRTPKSVQHSLESVRAVRSLQTALRPVRLEHPHWVENELDESEGEWRNGKPESGRDQRRPVYSQSNSMEASSASLSDDESDANPRELIGNLWKNYKLAYPKGKHATPKWQPRESATKVQPKESLPRKSRSLSQFQKALQLLEPPLVRIEKSSEAESSSIGATSARSLTENGNSRFQELKPRRDTGSSKTRSNSYKSATNTRSTTDTISLPTKHSSGPQSGRQSSPSERSDATWDVKRNESPWDDLDETSMAKRKQNKRISRRSRSTTSLAQDAEHEQEQPTSGRMEQYAVPKVRGPPKFAMTQASRLRAKSMERYLAEKLEREMAEVAELKHQFKAHPLPRWIYEPKYEKLVEDDRERRRRVQQRAQELLQQTQPFAFAAIPNRDKVKRTRIFSSAPSTAEEFARRKEKGPLRAVSNPQSADNPSKGIPVRSRFAEPRRPCVHIAEERPTFQPRINPTMPDFQRLHAKLDRQLNAAKDQGKWLTVSRPFSVATAKSRSKSVGDLSSMKPATRKAREMPASHTSKRFEDMVRPTRAFAIMAEHSRKKMVDEEQENLHTDGVVEHDRLRSTLKTRTEELEDALSRASRWDEKKREMDKNAQDYMQQLEEIRRKLDERPFLWEQGFLERRRKRIDEQFEQILQEYDAKDLMMHYSQSRQNEDRVMEQKRVWRP